MKENSSQSCKVLRGNDRQLITSTGNLSISHDFHHMKAKKKTGVSGPRTRGNISMRGFEKNFFKSKVARRTFVLFVVSAIIPIAVMTLLAFNQVRTQLNEQSKVRLQQESKSLAMATYGQLLLLRAELQLLASTLQTGSPESSPRLSQDVIKNPNMKFSALTLIDKDGSVSPIFGPVVNPGPLSSIQEDHLRSGNTVLMTHPTPAMKSSLIMLSGLGTQGQLYPVVVGLIDEAFFLTLVEGKPSSTEVAIIDQDRHILFSSSDAIKFPQDVLEGITAAHSIDIEWTGNTGRYVAGAFSLFMKPAFASSELFVVLNESHHTILSPTAHFTTSFFFIIIAAIGIVMLLSSNMIRKNMVPISTLQEATEKIAGGAFGYQVDIATADEFQSLGSAFNEMSTRLEKGQDLLVQAAKLSTIGQMSAGIVHEIKQPLTAIYGHLQLAMMEDTSETGKDRLKLIMTAVERLNVILLKFKSFSHMTADTPQTLYLGEIADETHKLLEHHFVMNHVHCLIENAPNQSPIEGDKQKLHQVLTNLLVNAMDALESTPEEMRFITIRTYAFNDRPVLEVSDNGCGITKEIRKRMFDPFFTTKSAEKGTGLGMAIVQSILQKHGATIEVESEVGQGTTFRIAFPAMA
jgi:signal transduction histidine kinase